MKVIIFATVLVFSITTFARENSYPNIVIALIDDLAWGDIGFYGNPNDVTPNINQICQNSIVYMRAYANSPVCSPSRAAILTGKFPFNVGIHRPLTTDPVNQDRFLNPQYPNINRAFSEIGYKVGFYGKWHLGSSEDAPPLSEYGIDEYKSDQPLDSGNNIEVLIHEIENKSTASKLLVDMSIDFMERNHESPFLLNLWFSDVHAYLNPSQEQKDALMEFDFYSDLTEQQIIYLAALHELDKQIERLENSLPANTILIIASDNGPETATIKNATHSAAGDTGGLRGKKRSLYEGGIRVPLIINWSEKLTPAINENTIFSLADLFPTLVSLVENEGATFSKSDWNLDGENLLESFYDNYYIRKTNLHWEYGGRYFGLRSDDSPNFALLSGNNKILFDSAFTEIQRFNITSDPYEMENTFEENPCEIRALIAESKAQFEDLIADELPPNEPDSGCDIIWDGETSSEWTTATNWSPDILPGTADHVTIPDVVNDPVIGSDVVINNIEIEVGGSLIISSGGLKVNGNMILDGNMIVHSGAAFIPLGTIAGSSSATIHRNTTFDASVGKYSIIGSPILEGNTSSLGRVVYRYDETESYDPNGSDGGARFTLVSDPETMSVGDAYFSAFTGDISFEGVPNFGDVSLNLVYDEDNDGGAAYAGFNLVSNPYTAAISYNDFVDGNGNFDGTIYLWADGGSDIEARSNSDYITANSLGVAGGGSSRSESWDGYIRSAQGFFVKATGSGELIFRPSMMDTGNNSDGGYFRKEEPAILKIQLHVEGQTSEILVGFIQEATPDFDRGLDAFKVKGNTHLQLYSKMKESEMAILALPLSRDTSSIPLGFDTKVAGIHTLEIQDAQSFEFEIYLNDVELDRLVNLKEQSYSFQTEIVNNSDRFKLVVSPSIVLNLKEDITNSFIAFIKDSKLHVRLREKLTDATVSIYNMNGKLIQQRKHIDFNEIDWITTLNEKGIFIIQIHSNDKVFVQKIYK
jgi:arylsulfatase A-like enzyme